ncbi:unnamed protein product [Rotaria socialis]|uniref:Tetraspanin n=1 Tax=Rotaria socialis TaxID=392032 RepID=A0A818HFJ4_9BILA|nr:unnamed protein product [Rotaria socialis]CAF3351078.1 unnamed protein product [Rotaria socialis]CAF3363932.1 unnamed protein product [Rotaria socialis]CAF3408692.1 unnamed protein product [Rotaria socialis]CAF3507739.1 unnamed protein product [Rotaria socialis]
MGHGGMSCGMKTVRLIMVLFNVVFFLIGVALLALGIYVMVDPKFQKLKEFLPLSTDPGIAKGLSYLEVIGIAIIVLGSVLLVVGFLGCCGAMKQVKLFLICYGLIVALIIIVEVAITIYFVVFQANFKIQFVPKLQQSIKNTYEGPLALIYEEMPKPSPISLAWDFIMYNFQCCGVEGKLDFYGATNWNRTNPWWSPLLPPTMKEFVYPLTCCPMGSLKQNWNDLPLDRLQQAANCALNGINIYETGCYNKLVDLLNSTRTWVIAAAVVVLVIELLTFIFTMALCCRERKDTIYYSS